MFTMFPSCVCVHHDSPFFHHFVITFHICCHLFSIIFSSHFTIFPGFCRHFPFFHHFPRFFLVPQGRSFCLFSEAKLSSPRRTPWAVPSRHAFFFEELETKTVPGILQDYIFTKIVYSINNGLYIYQNRSIICTMEQCSLKIQDHIGLCKIRQDHIFICTEKKVWLKLGCLQIDGLSSFSTFKWLVAQPIFRQSHMLINQR